MMGEVGDLAQSVGGEKVGGDWEKVGPWWGGGGLEGVEMGYELMGWCCCWALSPSLRSSLCWDFVRKRICVRR